MRILIINYEFPPIGAGGGKASKKIAESLVEMGHTVRVITSRPTQFYSLSGNILLIIGILFWVYLAYAKLSLGKDISDHGFTLLGTLCLLAGFILRNTALTWELMSPIRGLKPIEFINGVEVHRVPVSRKKQDYSTIFEMGTFVISCIWYCLQTVAEFKPDVVHVFFALPDGPVGWLLKRTHGLPYIISLRGADVPTDEVERFAKAYKILQPAFSTFMHDADTVVSVSNGLRKHAHKTTPDISIEVIPNAIDLSLFTPLLDKPKSERVRLIYVGRLVDSKSPHFLIEALIHLTKMDDVPPFLLELVGEGKARSELERMVIEHNLSKHVQFSGWIEHVKLVDRYRQADIFVTATTWEGMPNTVLEAMACGLPIIGTSAPGLDELVTDMRNGYIVPVKDAMSLADRLYRLIGNPFEQRRMGYESRKIAEQQFSWHFITKHYVEIYRRVILKTVMK